MATVSRTAGAAGSVAITIRNSAGQLLTPVSTPVVKWYTDAARTAGEVTLTVTGSGSTYTATWTAAQAPANAATRYLKVVIEVSTGVFDTDADDDVSFVDAGSSIETGYFTLAELRSFDAAFVNPPYTDADLTRVLNEVEAAIEAAAGVSFLPRTASQRLNGNGRSALLLDHYPVTAVSAVTVYTSATTSTVFTAAELADLVPDDIGRIHRSSLGAFPLGTHNIVVDYTHGYSSPAAAPKGYLIVRAARELFRTWMKADKASTDPALAGVRSLSVEGYSVTYADSGGTGVREVDGLIEQWKARDGVVVA